MKFLILGLILCYIYANSCEKGSECKEKIIIHNNNFNITIKGEKCRVSNDILKVNAEDTYCLDASYSASLKLPQIHSKLSHFTCRIRVNCQGSSPPIQCTYVDFNECLYLTISKNIENRRFCDVMPVAHRPVSYCLSWYLQGRKLKFNCEVIDRETGSRGYASSRNSKEIAIEHASEFLANELRLKKILH